MWIVFGETVSPCVSDSMLVLDPLYLTLIIPFTLFSLLPRDILAGHHKWVRESHLINFLTYQKKNPAKFPKIVHLYELRFAAELLALELITTGCVSSIFNVSKHPMELRSVLRKTAQMSKHLSEGLECTTFLPTQHPLCYFCVESISSVSLVKPDINEISSLLNGWQFLAHRCSPVSFSHD